MLDKKRLEQYDTKKMHLVYDKWPEIAQKSFESDQNSVNFSDIDHIIFAGMGGSGAIGDVFVSILSKTTMHTSVVKGYTLPKTVDENTLVVIISVSGNTEETLEVLKLAKKSKCKIIAFSSGGEIEKFCLLNNLEFRRLEKMHSPRSSFPIYLYGILKVLKPILPIGDKEIYDSIKELKKSSSNISSNILSNKNSALKLAGWISEIPIIYYPVGFQAAAIRFKNSLQENAKTHVMTEDILEATHNGVVAWERETNLKPILLRGPDDHEKTKERCKILKEFFKTKKIDYYEIESINGGILSKLVNLIYFLDYTSIYLSVLNNIDPSPVESIDFFKLKVKK